MSMSADNADQPEQPTDSGSGAPPRNDSTGDQRKRSGTPPVVVRYGAMRWVGEFSRKASLEVSPGARVVVQSDRGIELGECVAILGNGLDPEQARAFVRCSGPDFCQSRVGRVLRVANDQDINEQRHLDAHLPEEIDECAELADQLKLDLKVVTAEHLLGGERIVFYFRSQGRIDFRQLVKELAHRYHTRIEMRQVGARDEARLVADYEVCGRECCCKNFLKKLRPVNMKMAKLQKSTLDPSKVSGRCGRLRCCLRYEHMGYEELIKKLPRVGSRVDTEQGPATVLDRQILTQLVSVRTDDDRLVVIPCEEIKAFNLPPAPPKPADDRPKRGERPPRRKPDRREPAEAPPATEETSTDAPATSDAESPEDEKPRRRKSRRRGRRRKPPAEGDSPNGPANDTSSESSFQPDADQPSAAQASDSDSNETPASEGDSTRKRRRRRPRKRRGRKSSDDQQGSSEA